MQKDMQNEIKYHTKEEALRAVTEHGNELKFCTPQLKNDEDVVREAIKPDSWYFCYASGALKSNKTFIMSILIEVLDPWGLIKHATISIQSDLDVMALAIEKSNDGWSFAYAKGEVALNKEVAAKALVKRCDYAGSDNFELWDNLHPSLKEFFPKDCFYEKAQAYLNQLEQEKQAELVMGGSKEEDSMIW